MAKNPKPCPAPSAPGITTDRTIDERGIQKHHSPKLDDYDRRTTPPQEQQIYQKAAEIWIKNEKPKTAAVTGVMSFYNKRLVIKARLLDDPTPIIDTAESVPPNVRSASHFLPQREYIGRAEDRPKINQVVLVRVPPNGSYEVPGTIVEITDEITGPPIRVPKKKKDKSKGAKAAAKGQPAGGIPESPIPGDSTGKKVNPQNQIPKPVDAPPPPPGRRPGGKFEVIQEAAPTPPPSRPKERHITHEDILRLAERDRKFEEEKAKKEREEATRKAKEDAKKAEDIAKGKEQVDPARLADDMRQKMQEEDAARKADIKAGHDAHRDDIDARTDALKKSNAEKEEYCRDPANAAECEEDAENEAANTLNQAFTKRFSKRVDNDGGGWRIVLEARVEGGVHGGTTVSAADIAANYEWQTKFPEAAKPIIVSGGHYGEYVSTLGLFVTIRRWVYFSKDNRPAG